MSTDKRVPVKRIGLMGFSRLSRNLIRILRSQPGLEVAALHDRAEPESLAYLLRFDTALGPYPDEIGLGEGSLIVGGHRIVLSAGAEAEAPNWGDLGVDVVIESRSGASLSRQDLQAHLDNGAGWVVQCVPVTGAPDRTVVIGINDHGLTAEERIVSNASSTAQCAAPVLRLLDKAFGIERAFVSSVHAYTDQQQLADVPAEDPRSGRAAAENIIPQETNAAEVLQEVLPDLAGRVSATAMNVPIYNGSVVDLVCWHRSAVTVQEINEVLRTAAGSERWSRTLAYESEPIVSTDAIGHTASCIFDGDATMVLGDRASKTLSWFDNGWSYAHRAVDLIQELIQRGEQA